MSAKSQSAVPQEVVKGHESKPEQDEQNVPPRARRHDSENSSHGNETTDGEENVCHFPAEHSVVGSHPTTLREQNNQRSPPHGPPPNRRLPRFGATHHPAGASVGVRLSRQHASPVSGKVVEYRVRLTL